MFCILASRTYISVTRYYLDTDYRTFTENKVTKLKGRSRKGEVQEDTGGQHGCLVDRGIVKISLEHRHYGNKLPTRSYGI